MTRRVGVCSWSLGPKSPEVLAEKAGAVGVKWTQLALDPIRAGAWTAAHTAKTLKAAGIGIVSGMMMMKGEDYSSLERIRETGGLRPDEHWEANLASAKANAAIARSLGISLVSFHAGFLPHDRRDPLRAKLLGRLRAFADAFAKERVRVALETGQETASTLLDVLAELDRADVGVNFDPANLVLYGMGDPGDALRKLAPRVVQIHAKDAKPSIVAGAWGEEVPVGKGAVGWPAQIRLQRELGIACDLMIEREAGAVRIDDIAAARRLLEAELAGA